MFRIMFLAVWNYHYTVFHDYKTLRRKDSTHFWSFHVTKILEYGWFKLLYEKLLKYFLTTTELYKFVHNDN